MDVQTKRVLALLVLLASCEFGQPEGQVLKRATGPSIPAKDPNYLVIRPVFENPSTEAPSSARAFGHTFFFGSAKLLDLSDFDLRTAETQPNGSEPSKAIVVLQLTPEGDRILGSWSERNVGKRLGIFLAGQLINAPRVESRVDTFIPIDGDFTRAEAAQVVQRLRRGGGAA